jgi:hypothetical protein
MDMGIDMGMGMDWGCACMALIVADINCGCCD